MSAPLPPPDEEPQISEELAQAAIDAEGPDSLAFFRGLVVALCLSACLWLAVIASVLLGLRAAGFDLCVWRMF